MTAQMQSDMAGVWVAPARVVGAVSAAVLHDDAAIADLQAEWRMLADEASASGLFLQPAVWQSWHGTIGAGTAPQVMAVREAGRLVGVWPVMTRAAWRGPTLGVRYDYDPVDRRWLRGAPLRWVPVRQISPVLSLPATMLGPMLLTTPRRRAAVIGAIADRVAHMAGWDVAVIPVDMAEMTVWQRAFTAAGARNVVQTLDRMDFSLAHVVPLETVIAAQPQKFRANVRRARSAADHAGLRVSVVADLPLAQSHVARLAEESWKAHGRDGQHAVVPYAGPQQAFFEALLQADDAPRTVIATVMRGDVPVAITLGAVHGQTLTTLLTFWNGMEKQATPGLLCMGALVDWAAQTGITRIDFNTNSPWLRYLTDTVTLQHNLLVFAPTWRGRLLAGLHRASTAARDWWHRVAVPK
jgi:CelD/BcsL family acetyltransferase involved in cellulose biosynthesis